MKNLLVFLCAVLSLNLYAGDCKNYEAQVIGEIVKVSKVQDVCFYKIKVSTINEHVLCPLTKEEIETESVQFEAGYHAHCPHRFGGEFSGILVKGRDGVINFD
ncbi:MAG: hypothetical protein CME70_02045 [Halobacteriovorax sp.]|nr:hypothetical protein [Halobacteriovorax sp.]|tara:strand:+ start:21707 stop:22015 length:309 start_codon:yes stop_codon:yes gene_type:complete